jgi:hypothetical protein
MVIRLVTARWNAASRLLQNRTNKMTVRKSATKQDVANETEVLYRTVLLIARQLDGKQVREV